MLINELKNVLSEYTIKPITEKNKEIQEKNRWKDL